MPADDSFKRLGGGRWETRDERFAIEPQSGTWVIVDNTQTDDLGLPLVRGPFASLTAAKEAIEEIRTSGPVESSLAGRFRQAAAAAASKEESESASGKRAAETSARRGKPSSPPAPPEPKWLRDFDPAARRRARELIEKLEKLDIGDAEESAARGRRRLAESCGRCTRRDRRPPRRP